MSVDNTGMRKAILLSRYANLLSNWIRDERTGLLTNKSVDSLMSYEDGSPCIPLQLSHKNSSSGTYRCLPPTSPVPLSVSVDLGQWERQSVDLQVSQSYKQLFTQFKTYFESEMAAVGDATLSQEVDVLEKLSTYGK
jgi:Ca-activated chloride channel homolog